MCITYYNLASEGDKFLTPHFQVHEFADPSDYLHVAYPKSIPIHNKLPEVLEDVFTHFNCTLGKICSGYRSPAADRDVGGSGSGPHTIGIAADVYFYRGSEPVPSRLVACYLKDKGIKGIGLNCGGNSNGTHIDMRHFGVWNDKSAWYGDEAVNYGGIYGTVNEGDYYKYTNTTKNEVYSNQKTLSAEQYSTSNQPSATSSKTVMSTSNDMIDIIKTYEGLSLKAIKLSGEDYYTIGYGHYGSDVGANQTITEAEAVELLRKDLKVFEETVNRVVNISLTQHQFDALVSLAYNIGTGAISESDTVSFLNQGKIGHAAVDIPSWRIGMGGQILPGLQKRRQTELEYFVNGQDFTINDSMNVRTGPGTNYPVKKVAQISANGRQCVVNNTSTADAVFKAGTEITCLEVKAVSASQVDVWMRCPSGWICARQGDDVFIN